MSTANNKREQKSAMKSNAKAVKKFGEQKKDEESCDQGSIVEAQMSPVTKPAVSSNQGKFSIWLIY